MGASRPDFYLASTEGYGMEEPRWCYRIKRLRGDHRDDHLLIRVEPPFIGQQYGLGAQDIDEVVVAPRHRGVSLFPITAWPVFVHVARPLVANPAGRTTIHDEELEEIGWGELYPTEEAARKKMM